MHQSGRAARYAEVAERMLETGEAEREDDGALRFHAESRPTLVRADGRPTYQLASVVDDVDLGITHVIRGTDHLDNAALHAALTRALGAEPPEYIHHGLLLGPDGTKLSKRHGAASLADLRERGIPAEAVRAYLEELGLPSTTSTTTSSGCGASPSMRSRRSPTRSSPPGSTLPSPTRPPCAGRAISPRRARWSSSWPRRLRRLRRNHPRRSRASPSCVRLRRTRSTSTAPTSSSELFARAAPTCARCAWRSPASRADRS